MRLRYDLALWADGYGNIFGFPLGVHDERAASLPQLSLQSWRHVGVLPASLPVSDLRESPCATHVDVHVAGIDIATMDWAIDRGE